VEDLIRNKSLGVDQFQAELIKLRGKTNRCVIHNVINSIWNKEEFPEEGKESIIVPMYEKVYKTSCNTVE
jgi:hypothetical protein